MQRVNVFTAELQHHEDDPPGYEADGVSIGPLLGATRIGATI